MAACLADWMAVQLAVQLADMSVACLEHPWVAWKAAQKALHLADCLAESLAASKAAPKAESTAEWTE